MTDDVLLNLGQLTRAVHVSGCDVIWRSARIGCQDVRRKKHIHMVLRFLSEARAFSKLSETGFNEQLAQNLGSPATFCVGVQNDFLYVPIGLAAEWARIAQQMTDAGLIFTFAFNTAIYGIARMEDMVMLRTRYLVQESRADSLLKGQAILASTARRFSCCASVSVPSINLEFQTPSYLERRFVLWGQNPLNN